MIELKNLSPPFLCLFMFFVHQDIKHEFCICKTWFVIQDRFNWNVNIFFRQLFLYWNSSFCQDHSISTNVQPTTVIFFLLYLSSFIQSHNVVAHTPTLRSGLLLDCLCCLLMQLYDKFTSHKLIARGKSPCSMFRFYPCIKTFPFTDFLKFCKERKYNKLISPLCRKK